MKIWFFFWLFLRCWRLENRRGWYIMDANVQYFYFICFHVPLDTKFNISCLHHILICILKTIWWNILTTLFIRFIFSSIPFFFLFFWWGPYNKGFLKTHGCIHNYNFNSWQIPCVWQEEYPAVRYLRNMCILRLSLTVWVWYTHLKNGFFKQ